MSVPSCYKCGGTKFEQRNVSWTVSVGGHEVEHSLTESVCVSCGEWSVRGKLLGLLELRTVLEVLRQHNVTGSVLKDARRMLGLNREELALRFGVPVEDLTEWENNDAPIGTVVALALEALAVRELARQSASV